MTSKDKVILNGVTALEDFLIKYVISIAHGMEGPRRKAFDAIDQYKVLRFKYYQDCNYCGCEIERGDNFCSRCGSPTPRIN